MTTEKAIFVKTFKTIRTDGHSCRTIYAMTKSGIIQIERRMVSTELNEGFIQIRKFGKFIYQYERMVFKFGSFISIASDVYGFSKELNVDKVIKTEDVLFEPNEKPIIKITT